jgi:hypothetical protein
MYAAPNPPFGAAISYYVKQDIPRDRTAGLTIVDSTGAVVRELEASKKAGIHRVVWDLRLPPPYTVPRPQGAAGGDEGGGGFFGGTPRGPFVLPGQYKARLRVGDAAPQEMSITVKADPLIQLSEADYKTLYSARVSASRLQTRVQAAVRSADQLKTQIEEAKGAIQAASAPASLTAEANAIEKEIDAIIAKVRGSGGRGGGGGGDDEGPRQPSIQQRANGIANEIGGVTSLPTISQHDTLAMTATELDGELERLNRLITTRVPAFNASLDEAKVPWSIGRPIK